MPRLLCVLLAVAAAMVAAATPEEVVDRWNDLAAQYDLLGARVLAPAGAGAAFDSFRLRNPGYLTDSYNRGRTAGVIRDLLAQKPDALARFQDCGLSRGGAYFCRTVSCPVHGTQNRERAGVTGGEGVDPAWIMRALLAAGGAILLFVCVTAGGRPICAWLDRRFPDPDQARK
ncbi:MAG: hypothetical protein ABIF71_01920 [Planctomycetota bacterium]